jgi:hypothetical protein
MATVVEVVDDRPVSRARRGAGETAPRLALSRRQAAEALGMSLRSFQRPVQPHLRCVYVGRVRLYAVSELERWLRENACEGGRAA